jgi:hypothetical protein
MDVYQNGFILQKGIGRSLANILEAVATFFKGVIVQLSCQRVANTLGKFARKLSRKFCP